MVILCISLEIYLHGKTDVCRTQELKPSATLSSTITVIECLGTNKLKKTAAQRDDALKMFQTNQ